MAHRLGDQWHSLALPKQPGTFLNRIIGNCYCNYLYDGPTPMPYPCLIECSLLTLPLLSHLLTAEFEAAGFLTVAHGLLHMALLQTLLVFERVSGQTYTNWLERLDVKVSPPSLPISTLYKLMQRVGAIQSSHVLINADMYLSSSFSNLKQTELEAYACAANVQ